MEELLNQRLKAAWIALAVVISLTAAKVVLYYISGSLAVLSEAWHSGADIATTLLVLISIARQGYKNKKLSRQNQELGQSNKVYPPQGSFARLWQKIHDIDAELKIALLISVVLICGALGILLGAIAGKAVAISMPLATGLVFIALSFGSFFLYRFEKNIGTSLQSAALTADSQHNRADMAISLLTGISLILYHFGYDLDRYVGIFIALFILAFAVELLVNTLRSMVLARSEVIIEYSFSSIILKAFRPGSYAFLMSLVDERLGATTRIKKILLLLPLFFSFVVRWTIRLGLTAAMALYLSTIFYQVAADQEALVFRFGKLHSKTGVGPGLHLKMPYPVDRVERFSTTSIRELAVGNASKKEIAMIWSKDHGDDQTFISGDNNLFLPYIVIHYRIDNVVDYFLFHRSNTPEKVLRSISYRLLNQVFVSRSFYQLILSERRAWTKMSLAVLQEENKRLRTGLEIVGFSLKDLHPPISLAGAFEDVVAARQLREKFQNDAERQVVGLLTRERMQALQTVTEANSYVHEKGQLADGETKNYLLRYSGYQAGGETMLDLLFLEAAQTTLKGKKIYLVDPASGIDQQLVYLENYFNRGKQ